MTTTHPHSRSPGDALTPHARGLHPWPARRHQVHGIIPARAGFTNPGVTLARSYQDHPRTRGVYAAYRAPGVPEKGIIPARAGFTRGRRSCP